MVWDTYPSSSLLIWSQNPMMYSQSSCLLDGLVALSSARERKYVTKQAKRNSIKSHAFPRERRLTSIANYKKKERSWHMLPLVRGKGVSKLMHPNIQQESQLSKKQMPNVKYSETCFFHIVNESTRESIWADSASLYLKCSFYLAITINSLKAKPSNFLHRKLFLYSLGVL